MTIAVEDEDYRSHAHVFFINWDKKFEGNTKITEDLKQFFVHTEYYYPKFTVLPLTKSLKEIIDKYKIKNFVYGEFVTVEIEDVDRFELMGVEDYRYACVGTNDVHFTAWIDEGPKIESNGIMFSDIETLLNQDPVIIFDRETFDKIDDSELFEYVNG